MSVVYWRCGAGARAGARWSLLTALTTAATLVVLLPWALRNQREHGALKFTDDHGGITALIGANPNSEGTYTRALNRMFKDLTGRTRARRAARRDRPAGLRPRQGLDALRAALRAGAGDPEGRAPVLVGVAPALLADRAARACWSARPSAGSRRAWTRPTRSPTGSGTRCARLFAVGIALAIARAALAAAGADPVPARADRDLQRVLRRAPLPRADRDDGVSARRRSRCDACGSWRAPRAVVAPEAHARPARALAGWRSRWSRWRCSWRRRRSATRACGCAPRTAGRRRSGSSTASRAWRSGGATATRAARRRCRARRTACGSTLGHRGGPIEAEVVRRVAAGGTLPPRG